MSAISTKWNNACSRLNVKPKQFAMLLVITFGALGVLGMKMFVFKPKKAGASTTAKAVERGERPSKPGASDAPAPTGAPGATPSPSALVLGLPTVVVAFESRPMRDPFQPFFVHTPNPEEMMLEEPDNDIGAIPVVTGAIPAPGTKPAPSGKNPSGKGGSGAANAGGGSKKTAAAPPPPPPPEGPQGLILKAIIAGRVAVLNTMSVEEGDVIQDAASQTYTVAEIQDRSIVLTDGHRRFKIGYAAAALNPTKKGPKPK
jgi:hypothetical protein